MITYHFLGLIPDDFKNFLLDVTVRDVFSLIKLAPKLDEFSKTTTTENADKELEKFMNILKEEAPGFYSKISALQKKYEEKYNALPEKDKNFVENVIGFWKKEFFEFFSSASECTS